VTRELIGHEACVDLGGIGGLWGRSLEVMRGGKSRDSRPCDSFGDAELARLGRCSSVVRSCGFTSARGRERERERESARACM
jgi:hypothetical protein